jgi:Rieske Fe-S protein
MEPLSRRQVIKTLFLGAAFSNVAGRNWSAPVVYAAEATPELEPGTLAVNLADFPDFQEKGSIRIGTSSWDESGHRQAGLFPPVIINRDPAGSLYVLSAECKHEGCTVGKLDYMNDISILICPCHGSQYAVDGTVIHGPALSSLDKLEYRQQGEMLFITMPEVFYDIQCHKSEPGSRLEISFLAFSEITYELFFRQSLNATPERALFATASDGPLTQTELPGIDDYVSFFVDRPGKFGFFQVTMKPVPV